MADPVRVTQDLVETLADISAGVRQSQNIVEIAYHLPIPTNITQQVVETLADISATVRISQNIIELVGSNVDLSGIYFINPTKVQWHDTYYGDKSIKDPAIEKKIPDPTAKTALVGE